MISPERVRRICGAFPHVTEDIKWDNDLLVKASLTKKLQAALGGPGTPAAKRTRVVKR